MKNTSFLRNLHILHDFPAIFYKLVFLFGIASVFGYLWEVLLTYIQCGNWCNRGFLHGPWLPIYGFGSLCLLALLHVFANHPVKVFFLSGLIGGFLELITGLSLDIYWNKRYWDYTGLPYDLAGYVSLSSFLCFCVAGTLWVCILVPLLYRIWNKLSHKLQRSLIILYLAFFLADYLYSLFYPNTGNGITF